MKMAFVHNLNRMRFGGEGRKRKEPSCSKTRSKIEKIETESPRSRSTNVRALATPDRKSFKLELDIQFNRINLKPSTSEMY